MAAAQVTPGPGRPRSPRLDVDSIVDAARRIILEEGHEGFTLRRLGTELGVTAPAIYAHFTSKEELIRAVAHREFDWFISEYQRLEEPDPVERLRHISRHYVAYARANTALFKLMVTFPPGFFKRDYFDPRSTSPSFGARLFRARAQAVGEAIRTKRFVEDDAFLVGLALFTAVHGVASFLIWNPPLDDEFEDELTELVIDCMLRGLAHREPRPASARRRGSRPKTAQRAR